MMYVCYCGNLQWKSVPLMSCTVYMGCKMESRKQIIDHFRAHGDAQNSSKIIELTTESFILCCDLTYSEEGSKAVNQLSTIETWKQRPFVCSKCSCLPLPRCPPLRFHGLWLLVEK